MLLTEKEKKGREKRKREGGKKEGREGGGRGNGRLAQYVAACCQTWPGSWSLHHLAPSF